MKTLKKINDGFIKVSEYVAFVLSAIVCAMIVWWAFKRYVFASEFYGAEELILAIAFWMYFIGAYIATHEDSHISADLFTGMLKTQKAKPRQADPPHHFSCCLRHAHMAVLGVSLFRYRPS